MVTVFPIAPVVVPTICIKLSKIPLVKRMRYSTNKKHHWPSRGPLPPPFLQTTLLHPPFHPGIQIQMWMTHSLIVMLSSRCIHCHAPILQMFVELLGKMMAVSQLFLPPSSMEKNQFWEILVEFHIKREGMFFPPLTKVIAEVKKAFLKEMKVILEKNIPGYHTWLMDHCIKPVVWTGVWLLVRRTLC